MPLNFVCGVISIIQLNIADLNVRITIEIQLFSAQTLNKVRDEFYKNVLALNYFIALIQI